MAIKDYYDKGTYDIARGENTKEARKVLPSELHKAARRRLAYLNAAVTLNDLKIRKGCRLHELKDERKGQHSISINDQYRICFIWVDKDAERVEITDYHD